MRLCCQYYEMFFFLITFSEMFSSKEEKIKLLKLVWSCKFKTLFESRVKNNRFRLSFQYCWQFVNLCVRAYVLLNTIDLTTHHTRTFKHNRSNYVRTDSIANMIALRYPHHLLLCLLEIITSWTSAILLSPSAGVLFPSLVPPIVRFSPCVDAVPPLSFVKKT